MSIDIKYPKILSAICDSYWAIREESLKGIVEIAKTASLKDMRELFHAADENVKAEIFNSIDSDEQENDYTRIVGNIGILTIDGPIIPRSSSLQKISGIVSISSLTKEFKRLDADDSIEQIVMMIDSPGGAVTGVSEFSQLVKNSEKQTTAYVYGMAASAAYWIASAADNIISSNTGQVGSIGVIATVRKNTDTDKVEIVSSNAKYKRLDVETKEGMDKYLQIVNDLEKVFIDSVAKNRRTDTDTVKKDFGQGGILIAENALAAGMIDGISTLDNVLEEIKVGNGNIIFQLNESRTATENKQIEEIQETEKKENVKMNLEELLSSDPSLRAEFVSAVNDAVARGEKQGEKAVMDRIKLAVNVIDSDYPQAIKKFAMDVVTGKKDPIALEGAVVAHDAMKGEKVALAAVADTESIGDTPAQVMSGLSSDGIVRTEEDFAACVDSMRRR